MNIVIAIVIVISEIFFIGIGLASIWGDVSKRIKCKEYASGKIIDIIEEVKVINGEKKIYSYPIFEYVVNGNKYTEKFKVGSRRKKMKYSVGDELEIYYMLEEPTKYYIKGNVDATKFGLMSIAVGILFVLSILF